MFVFIMLSCNSSCNVLSLSHLGLTLRDRAKLFRQEKHVQTKQSQTRLLSGYLLAFFSKSFVDNSDGLVLVIELKIPFNLRLLVSSADNLCKQFGLRSGPTECPA